ncbi:MAG: HD domain-containing phosphohydrolase [Acetobacterium sp.]
MKRTNEFTSDYISLLKRNKLLIIIPMILLIIFGILFISGTWQVSMQEATHEAVELAEAGAAGFQKNTIESLELLPGDVDKIDYQQIKESLTKLAEQNNEIRFAYIYTLRESKIYFMADSERADSVDYSPPGQEYSEATEADFQVFSEGKTLVTEPITDRWGTWRSVLVPIKDTTTGTVIAAFGVDYPAENWNNAAVADTLRSAIILLFLFLMIMAFYIILIKNINLKEEKNKLSIMSNKLKESEMLFRNIFEQSPIGIAVVDTKTPRTTVNPSFEKILGRTKEEISSGNWTTFTHPDDVQEDLDYFEKFKTGVVGDYSIEKRYIKPDGSVVWTQLLISPLEFSDHNAYGHLCIIEDISKRIQIEGALRESERNKSVLLNNLPGMAYRCKYDQQWTMLFVSHGCFELTGYLPESLINNKKIAFNTLICPQYQEYLWKKWIRILEQKSNLKEEYEIITATGEIKWVYEQAQGVYDENDKVIALEGLIIDISDRKRKEEEIQHISDHDDMTGLHNRRFFEQELKRMDCDEFFPVSFIIGNINGVKFINDTFGYDEGDKLIIQTARILESCCLSGNIVARTSGDEFRIILPNTDSKMVNEILKKIKQTCEGYNKKATNEIINLNLSLGCGTKETNNETVNSIEKEAEDNMHKQKLLERRSAHSSIISSIRATMFEKSQETEEHAQRLIDLSKSIGMALHLSQKELDKLELFAMLHDIGKIGIGDHILNKPGKLSEEEWNIMKKHPEIGYRIAMSAPELELIAEYILTHHEKWDGKGYPQGLKGFEIPLGARIIAVADAYDAMTSDRPYRKAMDREVAVKEIVRNSGTQFDPDIVNIFINNGIDSKEADRIDF